MDSQTYPSELDTLGGDPIDDQAPTPRLHTRSNATRLLSAGAYLHESFRSAVIRELDTFRFRTVAPSYGYDAVTVLAHALAARSLRRKQVAGTLIGLFVVYFVRRVGLIGGPGEELLVVWVAWAFAFLRRVATLQALIHWLRPTAAELAAAESAAPELAVTAEFPANRELTGELIEKIAREQAGRQKEIWYGGYRPFVGAGMQMPDWTAAELLLPQQPDPTVAAYFNQVRAADEEEDFDDEGYGEGGDGYGEQRAVHGAEPEIIPFTVDEITDYVGKRLLSDLRDDAPYGEEIKHLTIERRNYSRAGAVPVKRKLLWRWRGVKMLPLEIDTDAEVYRLVAEREKYAAAREYLCIRVGAWDQEVVTSIFVGFDLRGNTLYSEFYPYLMPPVVAEFHLVDRLPMRLNFKLLLKVGIDVPIGVPRAGYRATRRVLKTIWSYVWRRGYQLEGAVNVADGSDFRLGRYAVELVQTGAITSVRQLAATPEFHHFFQEADTGKYIKVIERRLLHVIRDFLIEHNVDLADHDARQTTILDNSTYNYGDTHVSGNANISMNARRVQQSMPRPRRSPEGGA